MEPIAIVTALVAAMCIVGRGGLVVAPAATVALYRRLISTTGRIRILGGLLTLVAASLIVTARQSCGTQGAALALEGLGWIGAAAGVWLIVAPGPYRRLVDSFFHAASDPALLRAIGALSVAFGLGLGWIAFFVL